MSNTKPPALPDPDTTHYFNVPGDRVKYHSVDQIFQFANARVQHAREEQQKEIEELNQRLTKVRKANHDASVLVARIFEHIGFKWSNLTHKDFSGDDRFDKSLELVKQAIEEKVQKALEEFRDV